MCRDDVLKKVNEIFQEVFDDEDLVVTEATTPEDVEDWDSLEQVNLVVNMEQSFGVKFTLDEVNELKSVGEIITKLCEKMN